MSTVKDMDRLAEEIANSVTHGVGLGLSIAGVAVLMVLAAKYGTPRHVMGCGIYGATLVGLYTASTLYHSLQEPRLKELLRIIDHSAIYLLIAGTYTPFTLVNLRGDWGWTLLVLVWGLAAAGIVYKVFFFSRYPHFSTTGYLALGWIALIALKPMMRLVPTAGLAWLLAGGVFYTGGVWFYTRDRIPYYHAVWHLFVLLGSVCHYVSILVGVLPVDPWPT